MVFCEVFVLSSCKMDVINLNSCCLICWNSVKMNLGSQRGFSHICDENYTKVAGFIFSLASQRHKSCSQSGSQGRTTHQGWVFVQHMPIFSQVNQTQSVASALKSFNSSSSKTPELFWIEPLETVDSLGVRVLRHPTRHIHSIAFIPLWGESLTKVTLYEGVRIQKAVLLHNNIWGTSLQDHPQGNGQFRWPQWEHCFPSLEKIRYFI